MTKAKEIFLNKPQRLVMLIRAFITVLIWGRGTGKSSGAISFHLLYLRDQHPRGKTALVCPTYMHALANTLPPVIEMWSRLGLREDIDYFIGRPSKRTHPNWEGPYSPPLSYKHCISFPNGHVIVLISQDRVYNSAGSSNDAMVVDEAKHINYEKLKETFQTLRGNKKYFGDLSSYRSIFFATDMPTSAKSKWIFEYEKQMDLEKVNLILSIQNLLSKFKIEAEGASNTRKKAISKKIAEYESMLNEIRKGNIEEDIEPTVFFSEFSSLENMAVLGEEYIREQKRNLSPAKFRTSILNERLNKIEGGFYTSMDDDIHYYYAFRSKMFKGNLSADLKNKKLRSYENDSDVQANEPLYIALDYNHKINSLVVGQPKLKGNKLLYLNAFYVEPPELLHDVVQAFCDYYAEHPCKEVVFYYDHTAIHKDASRDYTFAEEVISTLIDNEWMVDDVYLGAAMAHDRKYLFINTGLRKERGLPMPMYNQFNCGDLLTSMELTGMRNGRNGFEKDKRPENDENVPPVEAPHLGDAHDTLYIGYAQKMADVSKSDYWGTEVM